MSKMGRGRGRGRGSTSINVEAIGFGRGDQLPAPALQPPPKYPPLRKQPIPLLGGDEINYLLALKKEFEQTMQNSPYYIRAEVPKTDVARYSDKYRAATNSSNTIEWEPDWRRLPKELRLRVRKRKRFAKQLAPNLVNSKRRKKDDAEIKKKLEDLEKKDLESEDKVSDKEAEDEDSEREEVDEIVDQEEDEEEENDYLASYFDNGESYLDEEDDTLDDKEGGIY